MMNKVVIAVVCGVFFASCQTVSHTKLAENIYPSQNPSEEELLKACSFDAGYAFGVKDRKVVTMCKNDEFLAGYRKGTSILVSDRTRQYNLGR